MIHIALSIHDKYGNYWPYVVTTLTSVLTHSSRPLHVHLLHDDTLSTDGRHAIEGLCSKYQQALSLHAVTLSTALQTINFGQFSAAAIYRLMLPQLLKHLDLVIYLDADIIFNQVDIADLASAIENDPHQHPLAAAHDSLFTSQGSQKRELEHIGIPASEYVNSGVLGIRPKRIDIDLLEALQHFVVKYPQAQHHDQDLLNVVFRHQIFALPERFNYQVNLSLGRCFDDLGYYNHKVLHYSGKTKPLSGTLSPADVFFWRYTQDIPNIHRYIQTPVRYLQKMHTLPNAAHLIATHETPASASLPVQWLTTAGTQHHLDAIAKDPRITLCQNMTWESSQADVHAGKARATVWSAHQFLASDYHLASRMDEWWAHNPRCVLRDAQGQVLLIAQHGISDISLDEILVNDASHDDASWDVQGHHCTQTQPAPLLIVTASRESAEHFFTHTTLGQSITQLRAQGVQLQVQAAANNKKAIGLIYNAAIQTRWANHIIVFVHDDVRLDDRYIVHRLHEALKHYDVVGVAGNRRRYFGQPAWHRPRFLLQGGPKGDLLGSVFHDTTHTPNTRRVIRELSRFGDSRGTAQQLDGVFIAARGRTLLESDVRFDPSLGFHFYDLDFCRTATKAGLRLGVWPIALTHMSVGGYESKGWTAAYKQYLTKWGEHAPHKFK
jgi:lipopolysaccharide biosynthesis glycosyltransferase